MDKSKIAQHRVWLVERASEIEQMHSRMRMIAFDAKNRGLDELSSSAIRAETEIFHAGRAFRTGSRIAWHEHESGLEWRCLHCGAKIEDGKHCTKPACVEARAASARRMGATG